MRVELTEYPTDKDWIEVKRRALVTMGLELKNPPDAYWRRQILNARHIPIRRLRFSFDIECPSWVAVHLCRHHVGIQPYVQSQRNDRQDKYDRNKAPQDSPVRMILDVNGEAMLTLANKRLCNLVAKETRELVEMMCSEVTWHCPEFLTYLVPMCEYNGWVCHEMYPCGRCDRG